MIVGVMDGGFEGFNVGFWIGKFDGALLGSFKFNFFVSVFIILLLLCIHCFSTKIKIKIFEKQFKDNMLNLKWV